MTPEALEDEELKFRDEQVAMLMIENPQLAEQLIDDGDLEDDSTDNDEFGD